MALLQKHNAATMDAIQAFVNVAFRTGDSLFTPGHKIWTSEIRSDLYERFVMHPDESSDSFLTKFKRQLTGVTDDTIQLAAELLYAQILTPMKIGQDKKVELIEAVLGWMSKPISLPEPCRTALEGGFVTDISFALGRPYHLSFLLETLKAWDKLDQDDRDRLLSDPWAFKQFLKGVPAKGANSMREILCFFVHPAHFEPISSAKHKKKIAEAFADRLSEHTGDPDKDILAIRESFSDEYGEGFSLYHPKIRQQWLGSKEPPGDLWKTFLLWADRLHSTECFKEWEINYKLEIAAKLAAARSAVERGEEGWLAALRQAFGPPNNLTAWQMHDKYLQWCEGHREEASKALVTLWGKGPEELRMLEFMKALPTEAAKGTGVRAALLSFLMMALDPITYPMYRVNAFKVAAKLSGRGKPPSGADEVQQYQFAINFLDDLITASATWVEPIANRLEAQGIVWAIAKWGKPDDWPEEEWRKLENYRKGEKLKPGKVDKGGEGGSEKPKPTNGKRPATHGSPLNVVLYGPPGTGKTYQAVELAVEICDGKQRVDRSEIMQRYKELTSDGRISFVTFHQSYGYEEFVEGYRPANGSQGEEDAEASKGIQYEVQDGAFKTIALSARDVGRAKGGAGATYDPKGSRRVWKMSLGRANDPRDARIYDECMQKNMLLLGYGEGLDFTGCDTREGVLKRLRRESKDMKPTDFNVTSVNAFKNEMSEGDFVIVSDGNRKFRAIGRVTGPYKFLRADEYGQMRSVEWLLVLDESMPREKISKKLFSQMTIYELSPNDLNAQAFNELLSRRAGHEAPNHVLIIDEINRGNISKILGELITLLEPDKRLGMLNELKVRLPYSGDDFGVPSNLYVIGTMNTADRSIAFLDTALRRRFEFEEVMPKPEVIRQEQHGGRIGDVDLPQLLGTINARIERLFDRDHMIGHSYLMDCKSLQDLRRAFEKKIIPLLQEYFYGDWDRVCVVLACPWDGDQAEPKCPNASPIITARRMVSLPWASSNGDDFEERLSYNVNPAFLNASDTALSQFFSGVASVSNGN